jgi:L-alanine-DL-glutamate epimerase-like enolase superfamily enzyme
MKVLQVKTLHADGGHKDYSFCKITTDGAIVGWSEYSGNPGVDTLILGLGRSLVGRDPRAVDVISQRLRRQMQGNSFGGTAFMAIAALENALIDIKAKAVGLPVCDLLGGPIHHWLPVYWTQCGNCRLDHGWNIGGGSNSGRPPVRSYADVTALGREAVTQHGFKSIKTMIFSFDETKGSTLLEPMGSELCILHRRFDLAISQ